MSGGEQDDWAFVLAPDSPDVRLFVELSSHGADLCEAHHAVALALEADRLEALLEGVQPHLIAAAVIAYCRTFFSSNVRSPLTTYVEVPVELQSTHELVGSFRNRTVAHSHSELTSTFPVVPLEPVTQRPRAMVGMTLSQTLPPEVLEQFRTLIETVTDRLEILLDGVRARIDRVIEAAPTQEIATWTRPAIVGRLSSDFNPQTPRARYPAGQSHYWWVEG
jgi:hypothetical protein